MNSQELPEGTVGCEHMASDDEIHLTYTAIQNGWQHDPGREGWHGRAPHTQLFFE